MTNDHGTLSEAPSYRFDIFIAGDVQVAKQTCRQFCFSEGLCVTVEPVAYVYTGGEEAGVRIGLINYPRFPVELEALRNTAHKLASNLMEDLYQHSYTVAGPDKTQWFSRRTA